MNADVQRQQGIHIVELTTGCQCLATTAPLFGGLEEQLDAAAESLCQGCYPLGHHQSPMAVWPSWAQACIQPALRDCHPSWLGGCSSSWLSSTSTASISKRKARVGPGRLLSHTPITPVISQPVGMRPLTQGALLLGLYVYRPSHDEVAGQQLVPQHDFKSEF